MLGAVETLSWNPLILVKRIEETFTQPASHAARFANGLILGKVHSSAQNFGALNVSLEASEGLVALRNPAGVERSLPPINAEVNVE